MGHSPGSPGGGKFRVVRIPRQVTEIVVTAANVADAKAAAKAAKPTDWNVRPVLQNAGEDVFEYDVIATGNDDGTT